LLQDTQKGETEQLEHVVSASLCGDLISIIKEFPTQHVFDQEFHKAFDQKEHLYENDFHQFPDELCGEAGDDDPDQ